MSNQGLTASRPSSAAFSSSYTASRAASPVDEKDSRSSPQPARAHMMLPTIVSGEEGLGSADESAIQVESPMEIKELHVPHPLAPMPMDISPSNGVSPIKFLLVDDNKINLQVSPAAWAGVSMAVILTSMPLDPGVFHEEVEKAVPYGQQRVGGPESVPGRAGRFLLRIDG